MKRVDRVIIIFAALNMLAFFVGIVGGAWWAFQFWFYSYPVAFVLIMWSAARRRRERV